MRSIEKVYIGIPENLINKIYWVEREHRTNPLSHIPASSDVIVEYSDHSVLGYDWIHKPSMYVSRIYSAGKSIKKVFARRYMNIIEYKTIPFKLVWEAGDSYNALVSILKRYDNNKNYYQESTFNKHAICTQGKLKPDKVYFSFEVENEYTVFTEGSFLISHFAFKLSDSNLVNFRNQLFELIDPLREFNIFDFEEYFWDFEPNEKEDFLIHFASKNLLNIKKKNVDEFVKSAQLTEEKTDIFYINNGERLLFDYFINWQLIVDDEKLLSFSP